MSPFPFLVEPAGGAAKLEFGCFLAGDIGWRRLWLRTRLRQRLRQRRQTDLHAHAVDARIVLEWMWLEPLGSVAQLSAIALRPALVDTHAIVDDGELPAGHVTKL